MVYRVSEKNEWKTGWMKLFSKHNEICTYIAALVNNQGMKIITGHTALQ
jgi:hypothetical protein